ncbi:hypothetical protein DSM104299_00770 [Baekduia alba]|uniref:discoidin domain-containing protein n=1 Tax=Baekduia alba TaxID=2997333 RepID=UPI0023408E45|nr:discoidin domain-containing protein [Baekduia alba]WCB92088.1 hypothetical protein DSM104299_00770 [Baekduia alba]
MSSSRSSVTALVIAVAAAFGAAEPAHAAGLLGGGVSGYVSDADTGLGLSGATLAWGALPPVAAEGSGRYLLTGLQPGETGTLTVAGPTGYEKTQIDGITLPTTGLGTQNVLLHRDWAASAGGAQSSSNDDGAAAAGCASSAATDNDRATGWSATVATHPDPQADPAQITIALPQTIDVRQFVIDPSASCAHDAGAALGAYRLQTSPDGITYNTAAEGTLDASARNRNTAIAPGANTAQIRFVRLQALAPQDAAQPTIDLRELQVFGAGPNTPPAGTVAVDAPRSFIKGVVRLRAAFTDADSTITRYLWDFDGDGRWDQATSGPSVAHVWTAAGTYHVAVGARDFRGGLGTAALDLRIIDPKALVEPVIQRKPLITFDPVDGIDLPVRIACSSKCTFTASLVLSKATAKSIKSKKRTVLALRKTTEGPGLGSWTITLPSKTIKLLRKAHRKSVKARLTASAVDQQKRRSTVHRWVTFR